MGKINKKSKILIETEYIAGIGEWPKSANVGELMGHPWRRRLCRDIKNKWMYCRKTDCEVWFSPLDHCIDRNWARGIAIFSSQSRALSILPIEKPRVSHCNIDRPIIFIRGKWENLYSKAFTWFNCEMFSNDRKSPNAGKLIVSIQPCNYLRILPFGRRIPDECNIWTPPHLYAKL
jgi:hypothetical protein